MGEDSKNHKVRFNVTEKLERKKECKMLTFDPESFTIPREKRKIRTLLHHVYERLASLQIGELKELEIEKHELDKLPKKDTEKIEEDFLGIPPNDIYYHLRVKNTNDGLLKENFDKINKKLEERFSEQENDKEQKKKYFYERLTVEEYMSILGANKIKLSTDKKNNNSMPKSPRFGETLTNAGSEKGSSLNLAGMCTEE